MGRSEYGNNERSYAVNVRGSSGVTLVELLIALAIASVLMLGVIAAFQTTQRTAALGEAREQVYQNARVGLDIMAKEISNAYIDNRSRDLVFVSADGLAGRAGSILEFAPNPPAAGPYTVNSRGLGNAQTPHGIDPTGVEVFRLYSDDTFGWPTHTPLSIKDLGDIHTIALGPPDRLDFTCMTSNFPNNATNESKLAEVRYIITTETFVDDEDNDDDTAIDDADDDPPGGAGLDGLGDLIAMGHREDFNPQTQKINALSLFQLRRGIDVSPDKNPFSDNDMQTNDEVTLGTTQGRYPARDFADFGAAKNGENIGSYIYDLQLEFYGRIALSLDSNGRPNTWGVGWGWQDVRGEDTGLIDTGSDGAGPEAIDDGTVNATTGSDSITGTGTSWNSLARIGGGTVDLVGGTFFILPSGTSEFDVADSRSDVYKIINVVSGTQIRLDRAYAGRTVSGANYRIIEPAQANGLLDKVGTAYPEDLGSDGLFQDPLDDSQLFASQTGVPNNVSDNDGVTTEPSVGEGNMRLDSRVMGIWDSRSPDPRNPRRASELNETDDDGDAEPPYDSTDNDNDGGIDDPAQYATPEADNPGTINIDESNDLLDSDGDNVVDDRSYDPAGKGEGIDEPDEANPDDDSLPKAVRITIAVQDPQQTLEPIVLSTTVWLSTAR